MFFNNVPVVWTHIENIKLKIKFWVDNQTAHLAPSHIIYMYYAHQIFKQSYQDLSSYLDIIEMSVDKIAA